MKGSRVADWLFWPDAPLPWGMAVILFSALTALAPKVQGIPDISANLPQAFGVVVLLACLNGTLVWMKLAPGYLTTRTMLKPWFLTVIGLSVLYFSIAAAFHVPAKPEAWFVERAAISQAGVAALIGLSWVFSGLPSMAAVKADRAATIHVLSILCSTKRGTWSASDRALLESSLKGLLAAGTSSSTTPRASRDAALLARWRKAAAEVAAVIKGVDSKLVESAKLIGPLTAFLQNA